MVLIELDDLALGKVDVLALANHIVQREHIVIAGGDVAANACASQFLVRVGQPLLRTMKHLGGENRVDLLRVRAQLGELIR